MDLDLELNLDLDRRDRERECELDREVRDLELDLEHLCTSILLIGDLDFRFLDDGDILFLFLDR